MSRFAAVAATLTAAALVGAAAAAAAAPAATTGPVTSMGATTATVSGSVNPNGSSTSWYVEYGTAYLARLSDDAVPTLVSRLPALRPDRRADLARRLLTRSEDGGGLLAWNASRSRARSVLRAHGAELRRFAP